MEEERRMEEIEETDENGFEGFYRTNSFFYLAGDVAAGGTVSSVVAHIFNALNLGGSAPGALPLRIIGTLIFSSLKRFKRENIKFTRPWE